MFRKETNKKLICGQRSLVKRNTIGFFTGRLTRHLVFKSIFMNSRQGDTMASKRIWTRVLLLVYDRLLEMAFSSFLHRPSFWYAPLLDIKLLPLRCSNPHVDSLYFVLLELGLYKSCFCSLPASMPGSASRGSSREGLEEEGQAPTGFFLLPISFSYILTMLLQCFFILIGVITLPAPLL